MRWLDCVQTASAVCVRQLHTCLQQPLYLIHKGSVERDEVFTCERQDDTFIQVCTSTPLCVNGNNHWILCMHVCMLIHMFVFVCS